MNYAVGEHFEKMIRDLVQAGRFSNASEVVCEGLRLIEEREAKQEALKEHLDSAIARGGSYSDEEIGEMLSGG